jgi:hypothetical protein
MLFFKSQLYDVNEYIILFQKKAQEAHALLEKLGPKVELVSLVHMVVLTE